MCVRALPKVEKRHSRQLQAEFEVSLLPQQFPAFHPSSSSLCHTFAHRYTADRINTIVRDRFNSIEGGPLWFSGSLDKNNRESGRKEIDLGWPKSQKGRRQRLPQTLRERALLISFAIDEFSSIYRRVPFFLSTISDSQVAHPQKPQSWRI